MFLKDKSENIDFHLKQNWKSLKLDFKGVYFGRYALCVAIYTYFKKFLS